MKRTSSFRFSLKVKTLLFCGIVLFVELSVPLFGWAETNNAKPVQQDKVPAVEFTQQIQPILAKHCYACHGPDVQEGGLRLDQSEHAFKQLDSEATAIVPQHPEQSELLTRIISQEEDHQMPPEGERLKQEQINLIRKWIQQGAEWKKHWAFLPPKKSTPPKTRQSKWIKNPIDAFILSKLEQKGLSPAPPVDRVTLIRRAYFNLTGLPPTPEEVDQFVNDQSPNAYEKLIDRLLASPRYGERWARHWLDLVRYADTNSFERDGAKPNAWRFRDYVIRSFNSDKPYDQFVKEQLAGDELENVSSETIIATGYYRLGLWDDEPADKLLSYYNEMDDIVSTTSQVFLGLTLNCARCHEHKIDPIPHEDYYSFLAFFHGLNSYGTRSDQRSFNQTDISGPEISTLYSKHDVEKKELKKKMFQIEQTGVKKMSAVDQRRSETHQRKKLLKEKLEKYLEPAQIKTYQAMKHEMQKLEESRKQFPPRKMALSVSRSLKTPRETFVLLRGNPHVRGKKVEPGFPRIFGQSEIQIPPLDKDQKTSGRRRVLAEWIVNPDNMLTSRVIVNRIWQHHFGRAIVQSPNNFGQLGMPPTHPELLDWLALEFVGRGQKFKSLHKLIMMSNTYQMSSQYSEQAAVIDPANDLFWRFNMRRLSAEEVRDSILKVNGRLNPKMYGPGFYPLISKEVLQGQSRPGEGWGKSSEEERARRSIYIFVKRSLVTPLLFNFDFADTDSTCAVRFVTTQPAQALGMINGDFVNRQAEHFANRIFEEVRNSHSEFVIRAIRLAYGRQPKMNEVDEGVRLINTLMKKHSLKEKQALEYFCLTILNRNEFVYLD
ncbi:PSD1 and planctomycete cytochrome C domain-containing protein [Gimesia aquarii]|uniref:Planctomycete cytochrome C n=1 Tax=Gimesia aquarii TaxID=2527964 RepID=A0A517VYU5_9PLAN|nr:PSD1 and planctomycete cytochrome C domain-containing protein [Gimesia aquarii]QDT98169.1 Planctomycete cytochrome C [Gimesia aquarii]